MSLRKIRVKKCQSLHQGSSGVMTCLPQVNLTESRINHSASSITAEKWTMSNTNSDNGVLSNGAVKGATTGILIGARFGPQGMAVGAIIGGVVGFVMDD
ncbi:MAG: putative membrane protein [Cocleimonas sp.]